MTRRGFLAGVVALAGVGCGAHLPKLQPRPFDTQHPLDPAKWGEVRMSVTLEGMNAALTRVYVPAIRAQFEQPTAFARFMR